MRPSSTAAEDKAIRDAIAAAGADSASNSSPTANSAAAPITASSTRELGELRIDTIGGADATGAEGASEGGRGAQPMAVIGSRVQWTHPINAGDAAFLKANSDRCRRSRSRAPARCTSAAAMPP